jgi:hypothetical protein
MVRDAAVWALGSLGLTAVEPDPSLVGFIRNASVIGSLVAAGWVVEARIGKKIKGAIIAHAEVEDQRLTVIRVEVAGKVSTLEAKIDGIHAKLDARPCAARCKHKD